MRNGSGHPVTIEHVKLRQLAIKLGKLNASDDMQMHWLAKALHQIGCGNDANVALGLKRSKGQDDKKGQAHYLTQIAIRWIAGVMNPIDDGKPPKKIDAIREAAQLFNLDEDNLARACPKKERLSELATFDWDSQRPQLNKIRD